MTRAHKIEVWIALIVTILLGATALSVIRWGIQKPITLRGAVLVDDRRMPLTSLDRMFPRSVIVQLIGKRRVRSPRRTKAVLAHIPFAVRAQT